MLKRFSARVVSFVLIFNLLSLSMPAAPATIVSGYKNGWQSVRFVILSNDLQNLPARWIAALIAPQGNVSESRPVASVRIYPGNIQLEEGQELNFSAVAYDSDDQAISGVTFEWSVFDTRRSREAYLMTSATFRALMPGSFVVRATTEGYQAEAAIEVVRSASAATSDRRSTEISSRSGVISDRRSSDTESEKSSKGNQDNGTITPNLLPVDGWDDPSWPYADDPGNLPGNPPGGPADDGAGNGNFQLSAPVISLPGRGIDVALNLHYNSRVWNKAGTELTYDIDRGFSAPGWSLGFGKLAFMGPQGGCMLIDSDGTRHGYTGTAVNWSTRTSFKGNTTDGAFIDYNCEVGYSGGPWGLGWVKMPNGTTIQYSAATDSTGQLYPTRITDSQGNFVSINYVNNQGPEIDTITDTLGRVITFHYDSLNRLIEIRAPRMTDQGAEFGTAPIRTLVRLHYKPLTLNYSFALGHTVVVRPGQLYGLDAIYYPATSTGYWFGDPDSYSTYGMLTKAIEQRGMSWTAGPDEQGTIAPGEMTKKAEYNYPLQTANDSGRTNGVNLSDAPTYTTLKESWAGRDVEEDAVTNYAFDNNTWKWDGVSNSPARSVTVVQPSGVINRQYSYRTPGTWTDGLVFTDETFVLDGSTEVLIGKSLVSWQQGNYDSPRPSSAKVYDENGHEVKTVYTYATNKFNQITKSCDYDNSNTLLRCSTADYENASAYIGQFDSNGKFTSGPHIFNLVKSAKVENPDTSVTSRTDYEYDNYTANALGNTPGVVQHNPIYNPYTTETKWEQGRCIQWEMIDGIRTCVEWQWNQVSVYEPWTDKRGNVTKVTNYADAATASGALYETRGFDVTGNLIKSASACCEEESYQYTVATKYGYPESRTRGAANPTSPHRVTTSAVYSVETGLLKQETDANGLTSTTWYNPDTLRPFKSVSSTLAFTDFTYDDAAMTVTEEVFDKTDSGFFTAGKTKKYLNGVGQVRKEESFAPNGIIDITETKYTKFGEEWRKSRPYRSGDPISWSEKVYDSQRRLIKVVELDSNLDPTGTETKAFYNESGTPSSTTNAPGVKMRVVDAWGRERWARYDQQGRLVEVVEPNPDASANPQGSVAVSGNLLTRYTYDTLGRLIQTDQGVQQRKFKYDSLGRLTHQKLAEHTATLDNTGLFVGAGPSASWSEVLEYDSRSNLIRKTDARGVKTEISYNLPGGGGLDPLNRVHSRSYNTSGPLQPGLIIHPAPPVTYEYMTSGDTTRILKVRTAGILTEDYSYDPQSRVSEYKQTIDYRDPMTVNYLYDSLDRVKEITYPEQHGTSGIRKVVAQTYDTASRLSGLTYNGTQQAGNIVYNAADQATEIKIGPTGAHQVTEQYTFDPQTGLLTNQKAISNSQEILNLSYEYNRGGSVGNLNGKAGHLTKVIDNLNTNKGREYEFDALGRLTKAKGGTTGTLWNQQYSYDRYGNRTNVSAGGTAADNSPIPIDGIPNLTYDDATNRITGGYEYDVAGNQTKSIAEDGVTWVTYEYDAANRLQVVRKVDANQTQIQGIQYGSSNARLINYEPLATGRNTFYATVAGQLIAEYTEFAQNQLSWTKSYTYLGDTQISTITPNGSGGESVEYNHPDRLGARLKTNQSAGTSSEQAHLPFGTALNAESSWTDSSKRFTSYERNPSTGMDYAVNRTYDNKLGRFTQVDQIGMEAVDAKSPQTLNLYTYCGNNPIDHTDPEGLFFGKLFKWLGKIFKAIGKIFLAVAQAINVVLNNRWVRIGVFILGFLIPGLGALAGIVSKAIKIYNLVSNITSALEMAGQIMTGKFAQLGVTLGFAFLSALIAPLIDGVAQGLQNKVFGLGSFSGAMKNAWHQFKNKLSNLKTVLIGLVPFMGPDVPADAEHETRYSDANYQDDPLDAGQAAARKHDRALIDAKQRYKQGLISKSEYLSLRKQAHGSLVKGLVKGTRLKLSDIAFGGRPSVGSVYSFIGMGYFTGSWGYLKAKGN